MAYKTKELLEKAIKAATEEELHFIDDVAARLPCSLKTFYDHKLHELPELKSIINQNKITLKEKLRKKWEDSDNPTLQMALYKLTGSDLERKKLSIQYQQIEQSGDNELKIIFVKGKKWLK